jgi:hypothetical protein
MSPRRAPAFPYSSVTTPPPERRPINTQLQMYNARTVQEAIQAELDRDGQIFYVVPKIQMMAGALKRLQNIFPDLRVMAGTYDILSSNQTRIPFPCSSTLAQAPPPEASILVSSFVRRDCTYMTKNNLKTNEHSLINS